jgi:hypothetical protein
MLLIESLKMSYSDFLHSSAAKIIAPVLTEEATIREMEALSRGGRPAVQALDARIAGKVDLDHTQRQHVGRWIRDVLGARGWRPGIKRKLTRGRLFASGAVYVRGAARPEPLPQPSTSLPGLARARELVRLHSTNSYGVDDFIADKRREAAQER